MARMARLGMSALPSQSAGWSCFDAGVAPSEALLVATRFDLGALRAQARVGPAGAAARARARAGAPGARHGGSLARRLAGRPEAERDALVLELVRSEVAAVLGHDSAAAVEPERAFKELGFDSLAAVELRNRLVQRHRSAAARDAGLRLSQRRAVAEAPALRVEVRGSAPAAQAQRARRRRATTSRSRSSAWAAATRAGYPRPRSCGELVAEGRDAISAFPADRGWDLEAPLRPRPGHTRHQLYPRGRLPLRRRRVRRGVLRDQPARGAGDGSPAAAAAGDLLGGAGGRRDRSRSRCAAARRGSSPGSCPTTTAPGWARSRRTSRATPGNGSLGSVASGRVAYAFGLEGPAVTVDTACSSSLVALHLACQALRAGRVLAGAGRRGDGDGHARAPSSSSAGSAGSPPTGAASPSPRRPTAPAGREGAGMLVAGAALRCAAKRPPGAGAGARLGGKPGWRQQRPDRAQRPLPAAGDPRRRWPTPGSQADVDAVEAHGTGTTLGDPIEAQALLATYGQDRRDRPLWLGSVKSNIGHTQAAAGVAGVIKMVMAMRHELLPQTLHVDEPSPQGGLVGRRGAAAHRAGAVAWRR